jgi:hypothetical protein
MWADAGPLIDFLHSITNHSGVLLELQTLSASTISNDEFTAEEQDTIGTSS